MSAQFFVAALMGMCTCSAVAETIDNDTTLNLHEVVVTSYRRQPSAVGKLPVPLNKAPLTVSSVSR